MIKKNNVQVKGGVFVTALCLVGPAYQPEKKIMNFVFAWGAEPVSAKLLREKIIQTLNGGCSQIVFLGKPQRMTAQEYRDWIS